MSLTRRYETPAPPAHGLGSFVARVPAAFFAMVLGLVGLGNDWRAATALWELPGAIGEGIMAVAVAGWLVVGGLYAAKLAWARDAALAEWRHPVQCCYVGLAPTATMLVALAVLPYTSAGARALFAVGAVAQVAFAVWRTGGLWVGGRDPLTITPVLYLPTVAGGFVLATTAGALGYLTIGELAFGAALFSWLMLESVVLYRLLVHEALSVPLLPTLGIQAAPALVGCVALLGLTTGAPNRLALALLGYGLLQGLVLVRIAPRLRAQRFAPSYWAFTFGVTASALAPLRMTARGTSDLGWLAVALFLVANLVVGSIAVGTVVLALRGRLLLPIEPRVASRAPALRMAMSASEARRPIRGRASRPPPTQQT